MTAADWALASTTTLTWSVNNAWWGISDDVWTSCRAGQARHRTFSRVRPSSGRCNPRIKREEL